MTSTWRIARYFPVTGILSGVILVEKVDFRFLDDLCWRGRWGIRNALGYPVPSWSILIDTAVQVCDKGADKGWEPQ